MVLPGDACDTEFKGLHGTAPPRKDSENIRPSASQLMELG